MTNLTINGPVAGAAIIFIGAVYAVLHKFFTAKTEDGENALLMVVAGSLFFATLILIFCLPTLLGA